MPSEHSTHPPQAGPSPGSRKQKKVKRALAWAPEGLALPLAVHVTLGRSITSGDLRFLTDKKGTGIPATSEWNRCGQRREGATEKSSREPTPFRRGLEALRPLCQLPPPSSSPRPPPGSPPRLLTLQSPNMAHRTQRSSRFHLKSLCQLSADFLTQSPSKQSEVPVKFY